MFWKSKKIEKEEEVIYWDGPHGLLNQYNLVDRRDGRVISHVWKRSVGTWASPALSSEYISLGSIQLAVESATISVDLREVLELDRMARRC